MDVGQDRARRKPILVDGTLVDTPAQYLTMHDS